MSFILELCKIIGISCLALWLHELTHYIILKYYGIPFKFTITKKLTIGFKLDKFYTYRRKKQIYLLPLLWCIPMGIIYGWFWGIFMILLGLKDISDYIWLSINIK
ncbi:MAG: hypothetical protein ACFFC1_10500 [Promethearchaeota archaeon]